MSEIPPPAAQPPVYPPPVQQEGRTNTVAVVALVLGFVLPLGGVIAGFVALSQIKRTAEKGRGLAIAGISVGFALIALSIITLVTVFALIGFRAAQEDPLAGGTPPSAVQPPAEETEEPQPDGTDPEAGTETDVFSLAVGDCFNDQSATEVTSVAVVDCAEAHDYEVYAEFPLAEADAYPGDEDITAQADSGCFDAFEGFVGAPYEQSTLEYYYFTPTQLSWEQGDRLTTCLITDAAGPVTGSLQGAAR